MSEQVNQLLADSRLAFLNQQNGKALNLALEAIKLEPKNADAYKCAGNAYMSMERYEDAIPTTATGTMTWASPMPRTTGRPMP